MQVEVEVAIGLDEASLPNWHGRRRNVEVMSGSKTTVSQSLEPARSLHLGNLTCNKAKGLGWRLERRKLSKLWEGPLRGRSRYGDVTLASLRDAKQSRGLTQSGRQLLHSVI